VGGDVGGGHHYQHLSVTPVLHWRSAASITTVTNMMAAAAQAVKTTCANIKTTITIIITTITITITPPARGQFLVQLLDHILRNLNQVWRECCCCCCCS
jgi:hypothetical protein